jgi:hypothetical protein
MNRDGPVSSDDSVEIYLALNNTNPVIRAVINSLGTVYDSKSGDVSWQGNWRVASRVDDASGVWELELAISFADLGMATPQSGDVWGFTAARTWRGSGQAFTSLTGAYGENFGQLVFTDNQPVVRELSFGKPIAGLLQGDLDIVNPYADANSVVITYALMNSNKVNLLPPKPLTISMGARDERIFGDAGRLPDTGLFGMRAEVRNESTGRLLHYRVLPFEVRDAIRLEPFFALSAGAVGVLADFSILAPETNTRPLAATFTISEGDIIRATEVLDLPPITPFSIYFTNPVASTLTNEIKITCVVDTAGGGQLKQSVLYRVPPVPSWHGAYEVPEEFVPSPWSPLVVTNDVSAESWHRRYDFGSAPFPQQIWVGESPLLADPVSLIVETADGSLQWDASAVNIDRQSSSKVTLSKSTAVAGLSIQVVSVVEFDGFMDTTITLTPSQPVDLRRIRIEIPLPEATAHFFHVAGAWGEKLFGSVAERDRYAVLDDERMYQWLGDDAMGLCWLTGSTSDWQTSAVKRIGFDVSTGRVTGYLQPWSTSQTLDKPLQIRIGLQATPSRRTAARPYRMLMSSNVDPSRLYYPVATNLDTILESAIPGTMNFPPKDRYKATVSNWVSNAHQRGMKYLPYQYMDPGTETDDYKAYWGDWASTLPPDLKQWRTVTAQSCFNSSYSDYYCHTLDVMMGEFGADGMYLDGVMAQECTRADLHGKECGAGEWPIFAAREHFKKLVRVARMHKGAESVIIGHTSVATISPISGLLDVHLKGENYGAPLKYDDMTPAIVRAEFGRQWGPQTVVLPQLTKKESIPIGRFLGLLALNGIDSAPSFLPADGRDAMFFPYWSTIDAFPVSGAVFMPYYNQQLITEASGRPVSLYASGDSLRLLIVAANQATNSAVFSLHYNGPKTVNQAIERIADPDELLPVQSNSVEVALGPWGFKLLEVFLTE